MMQFFINEHKPVQYFQSKMRYASIGHSFSQAPESTATSIIKYSFRKGNKISTETAMRDLFKNYAIKKTKDAIQPKIANVFKSFFISATPFIGLQSRIKRRGKITKHKVVTMTPTAIGRKSFLEFSSIVCISGRATKPFISRFFSELNTLHSYSYKRRAGGVIPSSTFYEKRALLYKTAYATFIPSIGIKFKS